MKRLLPMFTVAVLVAGCASGPVPTDTFYHLPVATPSSGNQLTADTIFVRQFSGEALYLDRAVLYSDGVDFMMKRHRYHFWSDSPPELMHDAMVDFLRDAGAAGRVTDEPTPDAAFVVSGRLLAFERLAGSDPIRVRVELELKLDRPRSPAAPLVERRYHEEITAASGVMPDSVSAFADATRRIFDRFLADARTAIN
ncbi:MAG: membrane integrity-associated transporter subunit PqiC [Gammaproteobacteria bacterium]|nr:membrane integrity-associated transporter subunit PqiC [Gammaproteobacteria bacterium]